jgi:hypothetical protein
MLDMLIKTFTQGDIAAYRASLLHSTFWSQHNAKFFGQEKLISVPLTWLRYAGRCEVLQSIEVRQENVSVIHLLLKTQDSEPSINYTFWLHNNGKVIKSVTAIVDTQQLAMAKNIENNKMIMALPEPDPLVIPDYDQQDNLQGEFAIPSSIIRDQSPLSDLLDSWWSIWSDSQLSIIDEVYADAADISLPVSFQQQGQEELFEFVLSIYSKLNRVFCQLEDIVIDGNNAAIKWFIDADEQGRKVRLPLITIVKTDGQHITSEITTCDILAFGKRHSHSVLFEAKTQ